MDVIQNMMILLIQIYIKNYQIKKKMNYIMIKILQNQKM